MASLAEEPAIPLPTSRNDSANPPRRCKKVLRVPACGILSGPEDFYVAKCAQSAGHAGAHISEYCYKHGTIRDSQHKIVPCVVKMREKWGWPGNTEDEDAFIKHSTGRPAEPPREADPPRPRRSPRRKGNARP